MEALTGMWHFWCLLLTDYRRTLLVLPSGGYRVRFSISGTYPQGEGLKMLRCHSSFRGLAFFPGMEQQVDFVICFLNKQQRRLSWSVCSSFGRDYKTLCLFISGSFVTRDILG